MRIIEIEGGYITLEMSVWETVALSDLTLLSELALDSEFEFGAEIPPHLMAQRETLSLVAGLWRSMLNLARALGDRHLSYTDWRFQELQYLASFAERRAKATRDAAEEDYPDAALRYYAVKAREKARPTDQQSGEVKEEGGNDATL